MPKIIIERLDAMYYAAKIRMKPLCHYSQTLTEIDSIYLENSGWYKKADVHEFLISHPNEIAVNIYPYPKLIPELSSKGEKYVRSTPNTYGKDNLLALPRE